MKFSQQCGTRDLEFEYPDKHVLGVLESNPVELPGGTPEELIRRALDEPVGSPKLGEIVNPGETVAVIVPDITRAWQSIDVYTPVIIEELEKAGIRDEDITIISATGTHRRQSEEEHRKLVSDAVYDRIKVVDHVCTDADMHVQIGTTSRGTPVLIDRRAAEADRIILTGAVVYHFLAGFGGGRKMILPGISARETIMKNHSLALNPGMGSGSNPKVRSGNMNDTNPFHADMLEAAKMAHPDFLFNVVADSDFNIIKCFAGDFEKAHTEGAELVDRKDGVRLPCRSDVTIATAGGFPKDINFYQTSKTFFNTVAATKKGGTMIVVSACSEGLGDKDLEHILCDFDNMKDREKAVRDNFSIGGFVGFQAAEAAENFNFILVTEMDETPFASSKIHVVRDIEEALALTRSLTGSDELDAWIMPHGANTMPKIAGEC